MANTKVTQHVISDNAITTSMITDGNVTVAKLPSTVDLSSKTLTLPSAAVGTTQSASDNSTKLATTAYVTTAVSNLIDSAPDTMNTLNEIAAALNDDADFNTTVTNSIAAKLPLAGGTMTGDLILGDNVKIEIGSASGGDLQIYHDGSNSIIVDEGTGGLFLRGSNTVDIQSALGHNFIKSTLSAGTKIYYNNAEKFETTDYGASTSGTGALKIPVGTTGQRPTAATGQIRFNSTDGRLEVYNGSEWSAVGATGTGNHTLDTFDGDGSTTAFSLSLSPANEDALSVFINGAYQEKGDYSLSGSTLTLDTAPLSGEKISVHTIHGAVHDGTAALNQQFTGDGSTTAFTLNADPGSENNTQIYINGVYQQKTDYTVSGTTLTFDTAPSNGDIIEVNSFTVTNLGSSDQVTEGVSNLYHTSARAISAISAGNLTGLTVDTNVLSVDATNDRVGIGTTSPGEKFEVKGDSSFIEINHPTASSFSGMKFSEGGVPQGSIQNIGSTFSTVARRGNLEIFHNTGGNVTLQHPGGNVGVGNNSPRQKFSVTGPLVSTGALATFGSAGSYTDGAFDGTALDYYNNGARSWSWGTSSARGTFNWYQLENDGQNQINSMQLDTSGNLLFNSGYGSAGKAYGVRAWARFNGNSASGTPTGGNVSSFTRTATGNFTINMTTAMPDTNYVVAAMASQSCLVRGDNVDLASSTTAIKIEASNGNGTAFANPDEIHIMVVR